MSSSKHIDFANRLTLFLLGLGLAAFWTASQQLQYQDRLVRYVYLDVLLVVVAMLENGEGEGARISRTELCREAGDTFTRCFGEGKVEDGGTVTIQEIGWAKPSRIDNRLVEGVSLIERTGSRWDTKMQIHLLLAPVPYDKDADAREFVQRFVGENEKDAIEKAFYVEFGDRWWPAILIRVGPTSADWLIVQNDWSNLWFIKSRPYGMNFAEPKMGWTAQFPKAMRDRIRSFAMGYYPVHSKDIGDRARKDAEKIQDKRVVAMTIDEAMAVILSKPKADIKVPGIPEAAELIVWLIPFVFCYSALLLQAAVYAWTTSEAVDEEPWLILNGKSGVEIFFSLLACAGLFLSGIAILWLVAVSDLQAGVRLAGLRQWLSGDQYYEILRRTLRESYDSSRDSGTPYFELAPIFAVLAMVSVTAGMIAIALSTNRLWARYCERNTSLQALSRACRGTMLTARRGLIPDKTLLQGCALGRTILGILSAKATILKVTLSRWMVKLAFSRWMWTPIALFYSFGLVAAIWFQGDLPDANAIVRPTTPVVLDWLGRVLVPFEFTALWGLAIRRRIGGTILWRWAFLGESISVFSTICITLVTASTREMTAYLLQGSRSGQLTDTYDVVTILAALLMLCALGIYAFGRQAVWVKGAKPDLPAEQSSA